jgi:hypothetical protein
MQVSKARNHDLKKFFSLCVVALFILTIAMVGTATAKTLYLVANHHTRQFDAWNINPDGTTNYLNTYNINHSDPAGIACWVPKLSPTWPSAYPAYIFITSEFSGGVEVVNASTFQYVNTSSGPLNLCGVAVDHDNDIVYATYRYSNLLYAYDWDPAAESLTLKPGYPIGLPGFNRGYGIAYNETTDTLWVADGYGNRAKAYNLIGSTWTEDASKSFTPSHEPIDIVVDRQRGFVYTVSSYWGHGGPGGSYLLSKYDLATSTETTVNMGTQGVGVAVDEVTGYVYVTLSPWVSSPYYGYVSVWDTSTTPFTEVQRANLGQYKSPAGICVPKGEIIPPACLHITDLNDGIGAGGCVSPGDMISYQISWSNQNPPLNCGPANNATLVVTLPTELGVPTSIGGGGTYNAGTHTILWNLGLVPANDPGDTYDFDVPVVSGLPGNMITTFGTIDSDDTNPQTRSEQTDICCPEADLWAMEYRFGDPPPGYSWSGTNFTTWMEVRIENQGSGDAFNVTAKLNNHHPVNMTIHPNPEDRVALGNIPAGGSAWSAVLSPGDTSTFTVTIDMSNPQDPDEGWHWDIEYDDVCGNHHIIYDVPEFPWCPLAPPFAEQLLSKRFWYPKLTVSKLYPNYPNPFNPETWIPYQVAKDADVTVRIFDGKGQLIKTIALGHKETGFYISKDNAAYWDGRNQFGEKVSSGVYFYTLHAGDFTATRKMVIMK